MKKFTRQRKLPFGKLVMFLLLHSGRSLQREIDLFYEGLGYSSHKLPLTKGAISRARSALCPHVFKVLNQESVQAFYQHAKVERWKGHNGWCVMRRWPLMLLTK